MFFARRRHAIRIVERFESDIRSPAATELIEMIVWSSKNLTAARTLSKIDCVILGANGICHNETAANRLCRELKLDDAGLAALRQKLSAAIESFATENGRQQVLEAIKAYPQSKS